jgi:glycosyltransferase involved in cell wall biosynthesis
MLRSGWDAWDTLRRVEWIRRHRFDIVHAVESRPVVLFPALYAQRRGAALIMDWCDWFGRGGSVEERSNRALRTVLRPIETYMEEHYRRCGDGTVTINAFLRDRALALGVRRDAVVVIRNGCDPNIRPVDQLLSRSATGLPVAGPLVGYVGMMYAYDARFMAQAINRVRKALPAARLVLVGYFNRDIAPWLDDPESVIRTGPLPALKQVHQYLSACDLCWLPLRDSGANRGRWPGKLNDYMSLGKPVVATAVGDVPEVIDRYGIGIATADDVEEFAEGTVKLLRDVERARVMGRAARSAAEGAFDWEHRTGELESFYQRVLDRSEGRMIR